MVNSITLETKCWENDWETILKSDHLQKLSAYNLFPFSETVLMINNVKNYSEVCRYAELAIEQGWISSYVIVKDYAEEALQFFGLSKNSLGQGYVYSIAELVSIYLCRTDFILHYAGDTIPSQSYDWIPKALEIMESDPQIKVANLTWNSKYLEAQNESILETQDFYIGYGFSDQSYIIKTKDFCAPIYSEFNPASQRYPIYGGELFEKRVDSWIRNRNYLRATYKHGTYIHQESNQSLKRQIMTTATRAYRKISNAFIR